MAVVDLAGKKITLKILYYGCALGGKTTNLITLQKLTDPDNRQGMVSIATKDDRTLFFDLLPMDLGQIGGLKARVKIYTVPGQVHYELTRRQILAGADGVVLVIDSSPKTAQSNTWAAENLRMNLLANKMDPADVPVVMQWNKRDLDDARPVPELEVELNGERRPSQESVATTGAGVVETFATTVKLALHRACAKAGRRSISAEQIDRMVDEALADARTRQPSTQDPAEMAFEHRVDNESYREEWAEKGRDRQILDPETLLAEAVHANMALAEKLDDFRDVEGGSRQRDSMLDALGRLILLVADPAQPALPAGMTAMLLAACHRTHGSLMLFRRDENSMDEREVVPPGPDPMNSVASPSVGSAAFRMCQGNEPRFVEDLGAEVFFENPPQQARSLVSCLVCPIHCDGVGFGALAIYGSANEMPFDQAERDYWRTAGLLIGLSLHWRGLRKRLTRGQSRPTPAGDA